MQQVLAQVDFPAFEQGQYLAARSLADPHLDLRISLRVVVQEPRQDAFDVLRRAGDLQDSCIALTEQLRLLRQGAGQIEKQRASRQQLLAFARQEKPASDT